MTKLMTHNELLQVQQDMQRGISICRATWERVVATAVEKYPYSSSLVGFFNGDPKSIEIVTADLLKSGTKPQHLGNDELRALFEKSYGPKNDFAWIDAEGRYKDERLQRHFEVWLNALGSITVYLLRAESRL